MSDPAKAALLFAGPFLLLSLIWAAHETKIILAEIRASKREARR